MSDLNNIGGNNVNNNVSKVKVNTEFKPSTQEQNLFAQSTVGSFWASLEKTLTTNNFSWNDGINEQITKLENEQNMITGFLGTPSSGTNLNFTC